MEGREMSKYVIELDEDVKILQSISVTPQGNAYTNTQWTVNLEELNSDYINEHFGGLQDTAYQRGLEEGKKAFDLLESERNSEYQRGLTFGKVQGQNEAWDCAKKISLHPDNGGMTCAEISAAFGEASATNVLYKCSAQQAIEKLKAYEKKQSDKIKVGDEVVSKHSGIKGILLEPETEDVTATIIVPSQRWRTIYDAHVNLEKTGKHYDIKKLLEAMKK